MHPYYVLSEYERTSVTIKRNQTILQRTPEYRKIIALFGSALSGALRPDSDIDLLVEFEPGKTPSLFTIINLEYEIAEIIGRKIDLRTPQELSRYFRDEVLEKAKALYVKS